jgi:hypothetical protein
MDAAVFVANGCSHLRPCIKSYSEQWKRKTELTVSNDFMYSWSFARYAYKLPD